MQYAAITGYIDVAQLTLYAFWLFFAGLIYYLHGEDKREGYPLENEHPTGRIVVRGFPDIPSVKTFLTVDHGAITVPRTQNDRHDVALVPSAYWPGAPLDPTGNPMLDGVGPASYADRDDKAELGVDGHPVLAPLRVADDHFIAKGDPDPRGMRVIGTDKQVAGTIKDVWVDRAEVMIRYLEVELTGGFRTVLLPMTMACVNRDTRTIKADSILAAHFAAVPILKNPDEVTKLEEDKIMGYYAGGHLYATAERFGPVL